MTQSIKEKTPQSHQSIDLQQELTTGHAIKKIRRKARQLIGHGRLNRSDLEDLEMDLTMALIENYALFDPQVSKWEVFVKTIVERTAAKIVKTRQAKKRQFSYHVVSLASLVEDEDGEIVPLGTQIGVENSLPLMGVERLLFEDQMQIMLDFDEVVSRMPEDLQKVCEVLKTLNVNQAAKKLEISRTYLREKIYRIREYFKTLEFDTVLEKNTATRRAKKEV